MSIYQIGDRIPVIDPTAFVFESATVIGRVELRARVSIWPYATIRGDVEPIIIGADSNVQEASALHTDPGFPLTVGENVTIGHQASVHGCTIGDGTPHRHPGDRAERRPGRPQLPDRRGRPRAGGRCDP